MLSVGSVLRVIGVSSVFLGTNLLLVHVAWRVQQKLEPISTRELSAPRKTQLGESRGTPTTSRPQPDTVVTPAHIVSETNPSVIHKVDPAYSEEAKSAKFQGRVRVSIVIDETGRARDIAVLDSPGLGLDEKIIEALEQWRFKPATRDGVPVLHKATVEITFHQL